MIFSFTVWLFIGERLNINFEATFCLFGIQAGLKKSFSDKILKSYTAYQVFA